MPIARFSATAVLLVLSACGPLSSSSPTTQPTSAPPAATQAAPTAATSIRAPTAAPTVQPTSKSAAASSAQLTLAPDGNEARFRAREVLARVRAPSDAMGKTSDVSGSISVGPNGIVEEGSKISVKMDSLATDDRQRDRFIKTQTLQTARFPMAEFVPREARGLTFPLPSSGQANFQLVGDLTIHGVTKPATWDVTATFSSADVSGSGSTNVTLDQFGMEKPTVASVLSIDDTIVLEITFKALRG